MRNILLAVTIASFSSQLCAGDDLAAALDKAKEVVREKTDKAKAWGEHMKDRNAEDLKEIEASFNKSWEKIKSDTDKALTDTQAEAKRVSDKLEKEWKAYKESRKKEEAKAKNPSLKDEDKVLAGQRVYTKINIDSYSSKVDANSFENLVKAFEAAMDQESLNLEDAIFVKNKITGDTLLHSLVRQAYALEKKSILAKQVAQLRGGESPSLEADLAYQKTLLAIGYFAESTQMGGLKNKEGHVPLDLVLQEAPISLSLARYLVLHDLGNSSKLRMNELFPSP